jgi:hypothetical protein
LLKFAKDVASLTALPKFYKDLAGYQSGAITIDTAGGMFSVLEKGAADLVKNYSDAMYNSAIKEKNLGLKLAGRKHFAINLAVVGEGNVIEVRGGAPKDGTWALFLN